MEIKQDEKQDQIIRCVDCNAGFILTSGEVGFYLDRNLNLPKRCPDCRRKRRQGVSDER